MIGWALYENKNIITSMLNMNVSSMFSYLGMKWLVLCRMFSNGRFIIQCCSKPYEGGGGVLHRLTFVRGTGKRVYHNGFSIYEWRCRSYYWWREVWRDSLGNILNILSSQKVWMETTDLRHIPTLAAASEQMKLQIQISSTMKYAN